MKTISAQSSFNILNEKQFARLMAEYVPQWRGFLSDLGTYSPEELDEGSIRHATAQVVREHPEVVQFSVMCDRQINREHRGYYFETQKAPAAFRAMFAEV